MQPSRQEEFAALWTRAQRSVSGYISACLLDFHHTEEVMQRVAVTLVRKFDAYDPAQPFAAWAMGVAKYEVLNYRRQMAIDKHVFDDSLLDRITESYQRLSAELDPMRGALERCIERMSPEERRVLEMRYTSDLKPGRIAQMLGLSAGAVRMQLLRARESLRRCIENRLISEGRA